MRRESRRFAWLVLSAALIVPVASAAPPPDSPAEVRPILIGTEVPQLTLRDVTGEPFDLGAALSAKPTILIFYRGGW